MAIKTRPPAVVLESLKAKGATVRETATALTERIQKFQEFLSHLKGRTETRIYGPHPDGGDDGILSYCYWFHKEGNDWLISCAEHHEDYHGGHGHPLEWSPLVDASIKVKIAAAPVLVDFLDSMESAQDKTISKLQAACNQLDQQLRLLGEGGAK